MFARTATVFSTLLLATSAFASPIAKRNEIGFSSWHGISSLDNFDNFYGIDNFDSSLNVQTVTSTELVCHTVSIDVIQQQMAILIENMKRVLTQQVCEVETQTILVSQVQAVFTSFSDDVRHVSGRSIGFDSEIAGYIDGLYDSSGDFTDHDFGFSGVDVGSNLNVVSGSNFDASTSSLSVAQAFSSSQAAF